MKKIIFAIALGSTSLVMAQSYSVKTTVPPKSYKSYGSTKKSATDSDSGVSHSTGTNPYGTYSLATPTANNNCQTKKTNRQSNCKVNSKGQYGTYCVLGVFFSDTGERVDYYRTINDTVKRHDIETNHSKMHMGGTVAFGILGPLSQSIWAGVEFGSDFGARQENVQSHKADPFNMKAVTDKGEDLFETRYYNLKTGTNGCKPFGAIRIGYSDPDYGCMVYWKFGLSFAKSDESYVSYTFKNSIEIPDEGTVHRISYRGWSPTIATGAEYKVGDNGAIRSEVEYRFSKNKTKKYEANNDSVKLGQRGRFAFRLLCAYHGWLFNPLKIFSNSRSR